MNYIDNNRDAIIEHLEGLTDNELIQLHNTYCSENNDPDSHILDNNEDFFEQYYEGAVWGAISAVAYGDYRVTDKYLCFNGQGNLESFNYPSVVVDYDELAEGIMENPSAYNIQLI